jgi:hypothetical protein
VSTRTRLGAVMVALIIGVTLAVACAGSAAAPACAMGAKSSGASKSGGASAAKPASSPSGGKTGGVSSPKPPASSASKPSSGGKSPTPPPPAYPEGGGAKKGETKPPPPKTYTRNTQQQDRAAKAASNPKAKPDAEDVTEARDEAPRHVTRGGTYVSNITNRTYIYHDRGYYGSPGYFIDIWDPYDPYNYWMRPRSPFYGMPYRVAGDCSHQDDDPAPEAPPQNINIQVTADGHVAGTVPVTTAPGPTTTTTTAPPIGADGNEAPPTTVGTEVIVP